MKKPKILLIGTTDNQGGAARVGWDVGSEMMRRGYDVKYIVGYKKSKSKNVYELHKPALLKWLDEHTRYNATSLYRHLRGYVLANHVDYGASSEILEHKWYKEADIVHLHNLHGNFFKLELLKKIDKEKKVVWTLHDMWAITGKCVYVEDQSSWQDGYHNCRTLNAYPPTLWDNSRYMWDKKREIYMQLKNTHIVSPSAWLSKCVQRSILKDIPGRIVYNGIDTNIFKNRNQSSARKELKIPMGKKVILFIGQDGKNNPRKGWRYFESLVEQYKDNEDLLFVSIGSGRERTHVGNLISIPFIADQGKLSVYYSASDYFVLTSTAELFGLVVAESMACGVPVVAFDVGGVPELVQHKVNGYISKYKDEEDLKKGIEWVLRLSARDRAKMGRANRERVVKHYSTKTMVDQYEKLYRQLMEKH